jgi:hypothetical protein
MSHTFLKVLREDERFEKVSITEPQTIVPYCKELSEWREDYDNPPEALTIQDEFIFVTNLMGWLLRVKLKQPWRKYIYYIGGKHHYFILHFANQWAGNPFELLYKNPPGGLKGYAKTARIFREEILRFVDSGYNQELKPENIPIDFEKFIKSHGNKTKRKFWRLILVYQKNVDGEMDLGGNKFSRDLVKTTRLSDWKMGFEHFFETPSEQSLNEDCSYA